VVPLEIEDWPLSASLKNFTNVSKREQRRTRRSLQSGDFLIQGSSIMPVLQRIRTDTRYPMAYFVRLRRDMLRAARAVLPGPERNQRRQIARSLRSLFRNKVWQDTHTLDGSE
jgi:hypothetical protein